jgi:YVTN family beta-propeller protein
MAIVGQPQAGQTSKVKEVLLDDIDRYYADGFGAASTPDGRWALVTASGANAVSIIDVAKLNRLLKQASLDGHEDLAHRLDSAQQFVVKRLATGRNPTAVVVSPDSHFAYIANRTDDTVSVIDLQQLKVASTVDLGGPKEITALRRGEQLFYDATFCYQSQLACASCHPHNGFEDGLVWSLETPDLGHDIVENRTLLSIAETSPFKWNGLNPNLATQDGPRTAMYIFRSQGFSSAQLKDLVLYIQSLKLPRNPHRAADGRLTEAQERGRQIFFRTTTNSGRIIPDRDRCYYCHAPQTHYTSRVRMDIGTSTEFDNVKDFDVPQIEGVYMRAPYLHDGKALTLEGIWTRFNPDDKHGITSDMNKVQLNDLIEFLKTL